MKSLGLDFGLGIKVYSRPPHYDDGDLPEKNRNEEDRALTRAFATKRPQGDSGTGSWVATSKLKNSASATHILSSIMACSLLCVSPPEARLSKKQLQWSRNCLLFVIRPASRIGARCL
jgi:hypothetical protein